MQYRPRPTAFPEARRVCYLAIVRFMSAVFSEARPLNTLADVMRINGNGGDAQQKLDRELVAAWLNFASGGFDLTELVDTDGNGTADTPFATVMANAEAVRLNPAGSSAAGPARHPREDQRLVTSVPRGGVRDYAPWLPDPPAQ